MKFFSLFILCTAFVFTANAKPETHAYTPESQLLLKKMQDNIKAYLVEISEIEKKSGKTMHDFNYEMIIPAQENIFLGLVLNTIDLKNGFIVLSVASGSIANKMGLLPTDEILEINEMELTRSNKLKALETLKVLSVEQKLSLKIKSKGINKVLSTTIKANNTPRFRLTIGTHIVPTEYSDLF